MVNILIDIGFSLMFGIPFGVLVFVTVGTMISKYIRGPYTPTMEMGVYCLIVGIVMGILVVRRINKNENQNKNH